MARLRAAMDRASNWLCRSSWCYGATVFWGLMLGGLRSPTELWAHSGAPTLSPAMHRTPEAP